MIRFASPIIGAEEKHAVAAVLAGRTLTRGPAVENFEHAFAAFAGGGMAVAVSSCAAALHLALLATGVKPGTEVIVPAMTHPAVANLVELIGARPVFIDSTLPSGNIDPAAIGAAITERTACITLLHYLGNCANVELTRGIAAKKDIPIIEDCALALGTRDAAGVHAGLLSHAGCFSFYPAKHMTTGEGGMLLTRHAAIGQNVQSRRSFGYHWSPTITDGCTQPGLNYRLTEMQAAIGIEQLKRVPQFLAARRVNYFRYIAALPDFEHIESGGGSYYAFAVIVPDGVNRDDVRAKMAKKQIETSVHYQQAVPLMPYYTDKYRYKKGQFPVAERIAARSIALPVGPHLQTAQIAAVAAAFKEACGG